MSKHTTGPWRVSNESNGTFVRAPAGLVASMESGNQLMRDANARLIAAAPALLEALEAFEEEGSTKAVQTLARRAIAQARGES